MMSYLKALDDLHTEALRKRDARPECIGEAAVAAAVAGVVGLASEAAAARAGELAAVAAMAYRKKMAEIQAERAEERPGP